MPMLQTPTHHKDQPIKSPMSPLPPADGGQQATLVVDGNAGSSRKERSASHEAIESLDGGSRAQASAAGRNGEALAAESGGSGAVDREALRKGIREFHEMQNYMSDCWGCIKGRGGHVPHADPGPCYDGNVVKCAYCRAAEEHAPHLWDFRQCTCGEPKEQSTDFGAFQKAGSVANDEAVPSNNAMPFRTLPGHHESPDYEDVVERLSSANETCCRHCQKVIECHVCKQKLALELVTGTGGGAESDIDDDDLATYSLQEGDGYIDLSMPTPSDSGWYADAEIEDNHLDGFSIDVAAETGDGADADDQGNVTVEAAPMDIHVDGVIPPAPATNVLSTRTTLMVEPTSANKGKKRIPAIEAAAVDFDDASQDTTITPPPPYRECPAASSSAVDPTANTTSTARPLSPFPQRAIGYQQCFHERHMRVLREQMLRSEGWPFQTSYQCERATCPQQPSNRASSERESATGSKYRSPHHSESKRNRSFHRGSTLQQCARRHQRCPDRIEPVRRRTANNNNTTTGRVEPVRRRIAQSYTSGRIRHRYTWSSISPEALDPDFRTMIYRQKREWGIDCLVEQERAVIDAALQAEGRELESLLLELEGARVDWS